MSRTTKPASFTTREFSTKAEREGRSPWMWVIGIGVVMTVIIAFGVAVSSSGGGDNPGADGDRPVVADEAGGVEFGQLRWEQVGRTELPFSTTAGPRTLNGVTASGFAHTEAGAILAAWQIPTRLSLLAGTDDIYRNQVLGTADDLARFKKATAELQSTLDPDQTVPRVLAWRPHRPYDAQVASYDFAMPGETPSAVQLVRFSVVWIGEDWRFQPGLFGQATTTPVDERSVHADNGWHVFAEGVQ
ncbi:hypothetical protein [Gordonia rubripertincta]|uniref:hypothetical protein n=1 Tax=Gordonia rubripertincta TaxID=36822 RepID=UPI000B8D2275|nr:hypothetical protein [Gordonia rubripertincta]ASR05610.1 hypothetical protein GCWB2_24195 [Gordonia rubripertincta]